MNTIRFMLAMTLAATVSASLAQTPSPVDATAMRLIEEGKAWLAQNELKKAEETFRAALKRDKNLTAAMAGLGEVEMIKQNWGDANDWYEKILDREPKNLDAMHHRALCYRETGKFKAIFLRDLDWKNSKKYFEGVLAQDSLYRDTIFQYALLRRYDEKYEEAILLGHHQVRLKPELVTAQRGLFRLYQYLLDNRSEKDALKWLQAHDSEHAQYFIGEAFRCTEKLDSAEVLLRKWLASAPAINTTPACLSLVRLNYQREQPQAAEQFFWQAVDGIRNQVDAELVFEDVKYIVTEAELEEFSQLAAPNEYTAFFRRRWISRDPTPAAGFNIRLAEHYRRLLYAEKHYIYDRFHSWFNNPDKLGYLKYPPTYYLNDRFNDRGLIYIRHGEPEERVVTVSPSVPTNDSWLYGRTKDRAEMVFHFVVDENASANNWRVAPFLPQPQFLEDRVHWDPKYFRLLRGDPLESLSLTEELARKSADAVEVGFRTDRHTWSKEVKPLEFASYTAFFKAPEGNTALEVYYSLPLPSNKELAKMPDTMALYEHGLTLHDLQWKEIERQNGRIPKEKTADIGKEQHFVGQYRFFVKPDSYHVAFFVRQPATQRLEGWKQDFRLPNFAENELAMSSIVLASAIEPASGSESFVKNGLRLSPTPSRRCDRKKPVYVYFEVYHLAPDAEGKSSFVVEYTALLRKEEKSGAKKFFALFGGSAKPATTLVVERHADTATSAEYLALDLGETGKGEFRLSIKVTDQQSGKQKEGFVDFALF
ncbi:GWxTD domain-containing protein [candidate division KSB1 bacterium]|nr:GWxTD domain-containing protein [candidate division KSB1 bacterium]